MNTSGVQCSYDADISCDPFGYGQVIGELMRHLESVARRLGERFEGMGPDDAAAFASGVLVSLRREDEPEVNARLRADERWAPGEQRTP